ncbi:MAG TPA: hypothetical protein VM755_09885 [Stellaceae bacterium]|nr:hypothetical protein [Stellaceae bacterium]
MDPLFRPAVHSGGAADFMDLFQPNAPWLRAARHTRVFKLYPQFVGHGTDRDLRQVIDGLKRLHIDLAIEFGMLRAGASCGQGVEGYGGEGAKVVARRIRRLGGKFSYIAMDEPLWFGHDAQARNACHSPIQAIARNAAADVQAVREIFPDVVVGDIEPISNFAESAWPAEMGDWFAAYRAATGRPLAFVHADVDWSKPWLGRLSRLRRLLRREGIRFGLIYNGNIKYKTDRGWIESAQRHFQTYESGGRAPPEDVIFQSWVRNPTHVLPEDDPAAFTYLINSYFRERPRMPRYPEDRAHGRGYR